MVCFASLSDNIYMVMSDVMGCRLYSIIALKTRTTSSAISIVGTSTGKKQQQFSTATASTAPATTPTQYSKATT